MASIRQAKLEVEARDGVKDDHRRGVPSWPGAVGAVSGVVTLLFFMSLVLLATFGREIPSDSKYLVRVVIAFGAALWQHLLAERQPRREDYLSLSRVIALCNLALPAAWPCFF